MAGNVMIVAGSILIIAAISIMVGVNIVLSRRKRRIKEQIYSMYGQQMKKKGYILLSVICAVVLIATGIILGVVMKKQSNKKTYTASIKTAENIWKRVIIHRRL